MIRFRDFSAHRCPTANELGYSPAPRLCPMHDRFDLFTAVSLKSLLFSPTVVDRVTSMAPHPSKTASVVITLIGIALSGFSLLGFSTHEITFRRSTNRVHSEFRIGRPQKITVIGWQADVIRLGVATVGFLFVSYSWSSDRRIAVRNSLIAIVAWLGASFICFAWWTIGS